MSTSKKIFVVGGTGAQGMAVIKSLVSDGKYSVRVLTRDPDSARAKQLASMGAEKVEIMKGSFTSEADLRAGYADCYGAFVNIDGFATGEKAEMFWAIRSYELAVECGIKMFVYGNLDYVYKKGGYDSKFRTGHYDGKGRIGEWILMQHESNRGKVFYDMKAAIFTTGPYLEMSLSRATPLSPKLEMEGEEEILTWRLPLTKDGAVPYVALQDCGPYVRWLFDNPDRASGMELAVAIEHGRFEDVARAFEKVTGHKARFIEVDMETYWLEGPMSEGRQRVTGYTASLDDPAAMSIQDNFTGFWNAFCASGNNKGVITRDYALLDEIYPGRVRSAEEFFRKADETAKQAGGSLWQMALDLKPVLKVHEDRVSLGQA